MKLPSLLSATKTGNGKNLRFFSPHDVVIVVVIVVVVVVVVVDENPILIPSRN
jgi:hypothetical protein